MNKAISNQPAEMMDGESDWPEDQAIWWSSINVDATKLLAKEELYNWVADMILKPVISKAIAKSILNAKNGRIQAYNGALFKFTSSKA